MSHEAFDVIEAFRLGLGEVGVEKIILLIDVDIHDAQLLIRTLTNIRTEPNLFACLELLNGQGFESIDIEVQVPNFAAADNVTEHFNRV